MTGQPATDFVPGTTAELAWCLRSWRWRIFSGQLYKIIIKEGVINNNSF